MRTLPISDKECTPVGALLGGSLEGGQHAGQGMMLGLGGSGARLRRGATIAGGRPVLLLTLMEAGRELLCEPGRPEDRLRRGPASHVIT